MEFHPLAIVHPDAKIGHDVVIEPFARIEKDVVIGDGSYIASQAQVKSGTIIGRKCKIFEGAIVGGDPQDLKYNNEQTQLIIGDQVTIREYCTINRGTKVTGATQIKKGALIMAYTHIAHDCFIDEYVILANNAQIAGHVYIGAYAIVGGMSAVQQFVQIGDHAFVGGGTMVRKDVPPYIKVAREPLSYIGVNKVGLKRRGFSTADIVELQDIYRVLFVKHGNLTIALKALEKLGINSRRKEEIIEFIAKSEKGIIRGFRQIRSDDY